MRVVMCMVTTAGKTSEMSFGTRYCLRRNAGLPWPSESMKNSFASQSFQRLKKHAASLMAKSSHASSRIFHPTQGTDPFCQAQFPRHSTSIFHTTISHTIQTVTVITVWRKNIQGNYFLLSCCISRKL